MIIFVGDKPSIRNTVPGQAFIGTKSHKVLQEWAARMCLLNFTMLNSQEADLPQLIRFHSIENQLVALGNNASKVLQQLGFKHFKLPHPSGRNRQLNNKEFIRQQLQNCKSYLAQNG